MSHLYLRQPAARAATFPSKLRMNPALECHFTAALAAHFFTFSRHPCFRSDSSSGPAVVVLYPPTRRDDVHLYVTRCGIRTQKSCSTTVVLRHSRWRHVVTRQTPFQPAPIDSDPALGQHVRLGRRGRVMWPILARVPGQRAAALGVAQQEMDRQLFRRAGRLGAIDGFFHGGFSMMGPEWFVVVQATFAPSAFHAELARFGRKAKEAAAGRVTGQEDCSAETHDDGTRGIAGTGQASRLDREELTGLITLDRGG